MILLLCRDRIYLSICLWLLQLLLEILREQRLAGIQWPHNVAQAVDAVAQLRGLKLVGQFGGAANGCKCKGFVLLQIQIYYINIYINWNACMYVCVCGFYLQQQREIKKL